MIHVPLNPAFLGQSFTCFGEALTRYHEGEIVIWLDFETQEPGHAWLRDGTLPLPRKHVRKMDADTLVDTMHDLVATNRTLCAYCGTPVPVDGFSVYYHQASYFCYPCWVEYRTKIRGE